LAEEARNRLIRRMSKSTWRVIKDDFNRTKAGSFVTFPASK
jgi:hypothetical protein